MGIALKAMELLWGLFSPLSNILRPPESVFETSPWLNWLTPTASFHKVFVVGIYAGLQRWGKAEPPASSGELGWGVHM